MRSLAVIIPGQNCVTIGLLEKSKSNRLIPILRLYVGSDADFRNLLFTLIITISFDTLATHHKKSVGGLVFRCMQ
jgi:hypothetical protein